MKKILITGATGFLGSRLVEKMSTINGLEILATGRTLKTQNISNKSNLEYVLGNLEDTKFIDSLTSCLLYTSPSPRDATLSRMPSSA